MRLARFLLLLLPLLAGTAHGSLSLRQELAVQPAATIPVTLAAGSTGTTTLGASATSAQTTKSGLSLVAQQVLQVQEGTGSWDVYVELQSASGFAATDSVTLSLAGGSTQTQVVVTLGSVTQTSGVPVTLVDDGSPLSITVTGTKLSLGTSTLAMQIVLDPSGSGQPVLRYSYTLQITL